MYEPSHHGVSWLMYVWGPSLPGGRVGSWSVFITVSGGCGHWSSRASGSSYVWSGSPSPWLNQSLTMNWIQVAASMLRVVAGWNAVRVSSSLLTVLGLGDIRRAGDSW